MVSFVRDGDVASFVCAAGIVSHYVGNSCQPLHISYMFNGDPDQQGDDGEARAPASIRLTRTTWSIATLRTSWPASTPFWLAPPRQLSLTAGIAAAVAVVNLMQQTFATIAPKDIIDAYVKTEGRGPSQRADALWQPFGEDTIKVMADGAVCLAQLWDSAWREGGGDNTIRDLGEIDQSTLEMLYQNPQFLPSKTLDQIGAILKGGSAPAAAPPVHKPRQKTQPRRSTRRQKALA